MAPVFVRVSRPGKRRLEVSAHSEQIQIVSREADDQVSLLEVLDHVLNQGIIIRGNLIISLAGVDLIYVGLDVILTSVETAMRHLASAPASSSSSR